MSSAVESVEREPEQEKLQGWWISWYQTKKLGAFELHSPWWVSGYRERETKKGKIKLDSVIVGAVRAENEKAAKAAVVASYDDPPDVDEIEWRFCEELNEGEEPWIPRDGKDESSLRFRRAGWMQW